MFVSALAWLLAVAVAHAEDWPDFRGPRGDGLSSEAKPPLSWSEHDHVTWKVPVPGKGWSTPIVVAGEIWLTTATDNDQSLRVLTFEASSGKLVRNVEVFRLNAPAKGHEKNSAASPSVLIEGERVYAHFGTYGTACLNRRDGSIVWRNREFQFFQVHGPGGSPVLSGDVLIFSADGNDTQFVAALDKNTGKLAWRHPRPSAMAYSTPLSIRTEAGSQVVSTGAHRAYAYDPKTGTPLWWVNYGDGFSNVPRPVFAHGLVFLTTGFYRPEVLAVRVDGRGDATSSHIVWRTNRGVPLTPSPIVVGDLFYMVNDSGIVSCFDARTGKEQWRGRLPGTYSASPVHAAGHIYFLSESGETTVIRTGKEFLKVGLNRLEGEFLASIAIAERAMYLRSRTHLYRVD